MPRLRKLSNLIVLMKRDLMWKFRWQVRVCYRTIPGSNYVLAAVLPTASIDFERKLQRKRSRDDIRGSSQFKSSLENLRRRSKGSLVDAPLPQIGVASEPEPEERKDDAISLTGSNSSGNTLVSSPTSSAGKRSSKRENSGKKRTSSRKSSSKASQGKAGKKEEATAAAPTQTNTTTTASSSTKEEKESPKIPPKKDHKEKDKETGSSESKSEKDKETGSTESKEKGDKSDLSGKSSSSRRSTRTKEGKDKGSAKRDSKK